jgi:hypothetical protein
VDGLRVRDAVARVAAVPVGGPADEILAAGAAAAAAEAADVMVIRAAVIRVVVVVPADPVDAMLAVPEAAMIAVVRVAQTGAQSGTIGDDRRAVATSSLPSGGRVSRNQ